MRIPSATYRLQFNSKFRFADAGRRIAYLHDLGITDVYASPLLKARRGSDHGYDVTDPSQLNPEIGSSDEFQAFAERLHEHQLGLLLDIVPNHMAADLENPWWFDVLAKGESSAYADVFDIDWSKGKILLPILGKPYGDCLESGELSIQDGKLHYFDHALPLRDPEATAANIDELDRIISDQHYRPAYWRKAADAINYRRFFNISDLIGIRAEHDDVFAATHAAILDFLQRGWIDGLRIDHVDGLIDPKQYLDRLPPVYVVVEKILGGRERIPEDWRAHGTTGYDFLNISNGAFIDAEGYQNLVDTYRIWTKLDLNRTGVFRIRKRQVINALFAGEGRTLATQLCAIAQYHRQARDLAESELREALISVTACLPVYRTYLRGGRASAEDRRTLTVALRTAQSDTGAAAFDFLQQVLLLDLPYYMEDRREQCLQFVMRWQQFTGPVMAKGLEDTTFYVHNPLISVNEVGGAPRGPQVYFGIPEFHHRNQTRRENTPFTMNASSTHDTKRSEDVRARINVLSEVPEEWTRRLKRWGRWNPSTTAPDPNEQILIYQTMLGAWPISSERLHLYLIKALREGKTHTSWMQPDENYEQQVLRFVDRLVDPEHSPQFLKDFLQFQSKIAWFGMLNSLSQLVLKIASPGVPDFYRGTEVWDYSVTDPDNRRPVDFDHLENMLEGLKKRAHPRALLRNWRDGRIKMFVTWKALTFRRRNLDVFFHGDYLPLEVTGAKAENVIAFARRLGEKCVVAAVPRLCSRLRPIGRPPLGAAAWSDTRIALPDELDCAWRDVFTETARRSFSASELFSDLPVCLLESRSA
jgi:(1->4)-alpha-D-glucan 1-alpha-D-glucosylmutase